jgi:hypothetical protein
MRALARQADRRHLFGDGVDLAGGGDGPRLSRYPLRQLPEDQASSTRLARSAGRADDFDIQRMRSAAAPVTLWIGRPGLSIGNRSGLSRDDCA